MKISRKTLKRIIKEEYARHRRLLNAYAFSTLNESSADIVEACINKCIEKLMPKRMAVEHELMQGRRFSITIHNCVRECCIEMGCEDAEMGVLAAVQQHFESQMNIHPGR